MILTILIVAAFAHEPLFEVLPADRAQGPTTAGAKFEAIRAKQDAIAARSRVIDQKVEYFLGMSPGPDRDIFAKQLLKEIEKARADNEKLAPAIELLKQAVQPKPARDR